jgi:hypothetical protein
MLDRQQIINKPKNDKGINERRAKLIKRSLTTGCTWGEALSLRNEEFKISVRSRSNLT